MSTGQFHKLLSPLSLGSGLTLKNRMIKAPQSSWFFEDDGSAGDRVIDFYEAIAAGGVGLVIVSAITWRSDHPAGAYGALHDDRLPRARLPRVLPAPPLRGLGHDRTRRRPAHRPLRSRAG